MTLIEQTKLKGWGKSGDCRGFVEPKQGGVDEGQGEVGRLAGLLQQLQGEQQEELGVPEDPKTPAHLTTVRNIPHTGFGKAFFSKYVHFELVQDPTSPTPTICYVGLPSSDCLRERDDTDLAVRNIASEVKREN